jgi:hypothetical protein
MVEREVVALVTRDRNPSVTPAGIQPYIGCVAQRVEHLVEAQGAQGRYLPHPPIMFVSCHRCCVLQTLGDGQFVLVAKLERHPASNRKIWEFESLRGRHFSCGRMLVSNMGSYPMPRLFDSVSRFHFLPL